MFPNLCEKYWAWVNKKKYITEQDYKVVRFGDKWAVKMLSGRYKDLKTEGHYWSQSSGYFRDCLVDKSEIERRFGKILEK